MSKTLFEKIWDAHIIHQGELKDGDREPDLLFVDLHIMHEVTSHPAFEGLRLTNRKVRHPELTIAVEDHNTPTTRIYDAIKDPIAKAQLEALRNNTKEFGIREHKLGDADDGVVHVAIPGLGLTHPGSVIVCGDSHTATHGAFGAIAFGIGTSEVEHVLATQTIWQKPQKTMSVEFKGKLKEGVEAKDMILALINKIGTGGGQGYAIEYRGEAIKNLSMEGRMTISNMTIEAGSRFGLVAPDETTFNYIKNLPHAPESAEWDNAVEYWKTFYTDEDAKFDKYIEIDVTDLDPFVTWGTNPGQGISINSTVPTLETLVLADGENEEFGKVAYQKALEYMGLEPGSKIKDIKIDTVFLGSCTNGRIEDLRVAAKIIQKALDKGLKMRVSRFMVVPGSGRVLSLIHI